MIRGPPTSPEPSTVISVALPIEVRARTARSLRAGFGRDQGAGEVGLEGVEDADRDFLGGGGDHRARVDDLGPEVGEFGRLGVAELAGSGGRRGRGWGRR